MQEITINLSTNKKEKPQDELKLGFGSIFTDHMFMMEHTREKGWHNAQIVPFGNLSLHPATKSLHYGQEVFEGLKAYRTKDGSVQLFRPIDNFKRLNASNNRVVIPQIDEEFCLEALKKLVEIDKDWVPHSDGASLYIRPFIFATDPTLDVSPSGKYLFLIILSPSGPYFSTGINPVGIYVEDKYVRAVRGGLGTAKTGANYAASLLGQEEAKKESYAQVLWLDGVERKYIEEVGAMNIFFVINDEIVTPELQDSILPGITRDSVLKICKEWEYTVTQRKVSIEEIALAHEKNELKEIFGTGTAAVISPVGMLRWQEKIMQINNGNIGEISQKLYDTLTGIQYGKLEDTHNWIVKI